MKRKKSIRMQMVLNKPLKTFKEKYISPKGLKLFVQGVITRKEAWEKYGKNRYTINPNAKIIKGIKHNIHQKRINSMQ